MIALVIEDGSIVANANSYATYDEIVDYAEARGVTLAQGSPVDETMVVIQAINAMDYLEALKYRYIGERVSPSEQRLAWPRKNAYAEGCYLLPSDEIPADLVKAQCQLCIEISRGVSLLPTSNTSAFVVREKVGPLETEYSAAVQQAMGSLPVMPAVDALLQGLLNAATGINVRTARV